MAKQKRIPTRGSAPRSRQRYEEGWEDFSLKAEWFRKYRDPGAGRSLQEVYDAALVQAHRMENHIHETPPMPEKALRKAMLGLESHRKATVTATKNPNAKGAIGFASGAVKISGEVISLTRCFTSR
jgi:hypothetical protein